MELKDDLGNRMKNFYESVPKTYLMRRCPVIIRIDGKNFHTFTKGLHKPFDTILVQSVHSTMKYLCEHIQGCICGYTQSDEITLVLIDYQNLNTSAWFDYNVQKICSISASMATMAFNKVFRELVEREEYLWDQTNSISFSDVTTYRQHRQYMQLLYKAVNNGAMFDARCFNIPKEEVANMLYWRQLDAIRNSIQSCGQAHFSAKQLQGLSCIDIKKKLKEIGSPWEDETICNQRGSFCKRRKNEQEMSVPFECSESLWEIDIKMPILKDDWNYVNQYIFID